jgi:electron transfer flavoprotein beta subunit
MAREVSKMPYNIVVLAKQVPDTKAVTGKAMKDDGTVNRQALPTIFNPDDLYALELALAIKDAHGGKVTVITMGPPQAASLLRETLFRGADRVALVTDRRAAASDTLATSYILSCAVKYAAPYDLVICGRQAIDGDTAQVGPQLAEKLGIPQVTYVQEFVSAKGGKVTLKRATDYATEIVEAPTPVLLTVTDKAPTPRYPSMKRVMQFKKSMTASEAKAANKPAPTCGFLIEEWTLDTIQADPDRCGTKGSPTSVKRIQAIVLKGSQFKQIEPKEPAIEGLIHELIEDHTIG